MNAYQGENDPNHRFSIDHLASKEPNSVEELLHQGKITLAEFMAAGAMREAKAAPLGSQLQDMDVYLARKKAQQHLPPAPALKGSLLDVLEDAGVIRPADGRARK